MTKHLFDNILKTKAIRPNLIYALNGCSVGLAFVLIFLELQTFFIKKPTSTEQTTTGLNFRIAPQILFCLQPAFRLEVLNSLGYNGNGLWSDRNHFTIKSFLFSGTFQFFFGNIDKTDKSPDFQYGWSNIKDKTDIDHHFSFLKNVSDLVNWAMLIYTDERNAKQYITIQPKFQRLSYPLGRCLRYHHSILTRAVEGVTT